MHLQTIVIALPLEEELLTPFYQWGKNFDFSHVKNVYFIHSVKKNIMPLEFGMMESPDETTFNQMKPTMEKFLKDEALKILPSHFQGKSEFLITLDYHPDQAMVEKLRELNANLLVVSTRGKHGIKGLFQSSFTDSMIKFAPCDVLVVRPKP